MRQHPREVSVRRAGRSREGVGGQAKSGRSERRSLGSVAQVGAGRTQSQARRELHATRGPRRAPRRRMPALGQPHGPRSRSDHDGDCKRRTFAVALRTVRGSIGGGCGFKSISILDRYVKSAGSASPGSVDHAHIDRARHIRVAMACAPDRGATGTLGRARCLSWPRSNRRADPWLRPRAPQGTLVRTARPNG